MHEIRKITVQDIAREGKVHPSTVSRALANHPALSPQTKARIQEIARQLGYTPDPLISALLKRRYRKQGKEIGTIAWIDNSLTKDSYENNPFSFNAQSFNGAQSQAHKRGYRIERFWSKEPSMSGDRLSDILYSRGIRGICVSPFGELNPYFHMKWELFSAAAIGYSMHAPTLHRATPHHMHNILLAIDSLRSMGYERIAMNVSHKNNQKIGDIYTAAALLSQKRFGKKNIFFKIHRDYQNISQAQEELKPWLHKIKPEVFLTTFQHKELTTDIMVPPGVKVAKVGRYYYNRKLKDPISYLDEKTEIIGAAAVDLVIGQIERNETGIPQDPKVVMVEGRWVP